MLLLNGGFAITTVYLFSYVKWFERVSVKTIFGGGITFAMSFQYDDMVPVFLFVIKIHDLPLSVSYKIQWLHCCP